MDASEARYSRANLTAALRRLHIRAGDTLFVHVCPESLGTPEGCDTADARCALLLAALLEVVGPRGTLLVPTYTFSFCRQELFDVHHTPTRGGPWSTDAEFLEYFRRLPGVVRSRDPIHSVAGFGPLAEELLTDVAPTCFGAGSVFDRLRQVGGHICLIGAGLGEATFLHHVEEMVGVPFRYQKLFTGTIRDGDVARKAGWLYNVHILAENGTPDGRRLEAKARAAGVCRSMGVGAGEVLAVECRAFFDLTWRALTEDPWLTAAGPAGDPVALEDARVGGGAQREVHLPPNASMAQMVDALWRLPRDLVSDGYDAALGALATQLPMTIHEYPTGTECWSWIVPEKWECHEAYLETLDGRRLFSYADHPLHVVSYSLPFEGEVSREELLKHLHVHHQLADAIPFIFKYYERDWGLCCTRAMRETLTDERYRVVIRTSSSYGTLKVGEIVAPGKSERTIVLCAHLCHPAMVNDDLSGVVVGMDVMRALLARRDLNYTYRFLIVPETIGSVAYLSHHESLIPQMHGGLFLEMLGVEQPHALQRSLAGDTELDDCFTLALQAHDPYGWAAPFWKVIGNDERQFNAPGVRVPMLSLTRVLPAGARNWPYLGYHSSADNPGIISIRRLEDSRDLVLRMVDTIDTNATPVNLFRGEVFCSRYGIHIDWWENREANEAFFDVLMLIDGRRSIAQIAKQCGVPFESARSVVEVLRQHGLVEVPTVAEGVAAPVADGVTAPVAAPRSAGVSLPASAARGERPVSSLQAR